MIFMFYKTLKQTSREVCGHELSPTEFIPAAGTVLRTSLGRGGLFFRGLWEHNARTILGKVKGIQDGSKGIEVLRPGVVPMDFPDDVASVQELKVPDDSI